MAEIEVRVGFGVRGENIEIISSFFSSSSHPLLFSALLAIEIYIYMMFFEDSNRTFLYFLLTI